MPLRLREQRRLLARMRDDARALGDTDLEQHAEEKLAELQPAPPQQPAARTLFAAADRDAAAAKRAVDDSIAELERAKA
eukprot:12853721-Alexandrium_andersonii.AAC.1